MSATPRISILDDTALSRDRALAIVSETLHKADDGELFLERRQAESLVYDDGKLKSASFDESQGFGLRAVSGETAAYAHGTEFSESALKRAAEVCATVTRGSPGGAAALSPPRSNTRLYADTNPATAQAFPQKIDLLQKADSVSFLQSLQKDGLLLPAKIENHRKLCTSIFHCCKNNHCQILRHLIL